MKSHIVSQKYVCGPCLKGQHGDCKAFNQLFPNVRHCLCSRYKHDIQLRELLPAKKPRKRPASSGTSGEIAAAQALTNAGLHFKMQVPIKTRFREWPFIVDFLVENKVVYEVQGGLHYKTWGGKVANMRMKKDRAKRNCLIAEGYPFVESTDVEIKKSPETVIFRINAALFDPKAYMVIDSLERAELEENK